MEPERHSLYFLSLCVSMVVGVVFFYFVVVVGVGGYGYINGIYGLYVLKMANDS